jgi:hypothetical protein
MVHGNVSAAATRPRRSPGPPPAIASLRREGLRALLVRCLGSDCYRPLVGIEFDALGLPEETPFPEIKTLCRFRRRGLRAALVRCHASVRIGGSTTPGGGESGTLSALARDYWTVAKRITSASFGCRKARPIPRSAWMAPNKTAPQATTYVPPPLAIE